MLQASIKTSKKTQILSLSCPLEPPGPPSTLRSTHQPVLSSLPVFGSDGHAVDEGTDGPSTSRRHRRRRHRRDVVLKRRVDRVHAVVRDESF